MFNRSRRRGLILGLVIALVLVVAMSCAPTPAPTPVTPAPTPVTPAPTPTPTPPAFESVNLKLGSSNPASSFYIYGETIARITNKYAEDIYLTHIETGATHDNLRRIKAGTLDMGTISSMAGANEGYFGIGAYEGEPFDKARIMEMCTEALYLVAVRGDLGIEKPEDLAGYDFNYGMAGSDAQLQTKRLFEALGIDVKEYPGTTTEAVSAIKDRRIAGYAKAAPGGNSVDASHLDLMTAMDLTFLGFTEEQKNTVQAKWSIMPWSYVEAGQIEQLPDLPAFYIHSVIPITFGTSDISQEVGYRIAKAHFENADEVNAGWPWHTRFSTPAANLAVIVGQAQCMPLHAGYVQYYQEVGVDVPESLIPPEYKG